MSEHWYTEDCPACGAKNWINNGDETDQTVDDVTDYTCWQCEARIRIIGGEYDDEHYPRVIDENNEEDAGSHVPGLEHPD